MSSLAYFWLIYSADAWIEVYRFNWRFIVGVYLAVTAPIVSNIARSLTTCFNHLIPTSWMSRTFLAILKAVDMPFLLHIKNINPNLLIIVIPAICLYLTAFPLPFTFYRRPYLRFPARRHFFPKYINIVWFATWVHHVPSTSPSIIFAPPLMDKTNTSVNSTGITKISLTF